MMDISYNKHADVLYIVLSSTPHHCTYVELPGGIITRVDDETNKVVGVTVYNFSNKMQSGESISIPQVGLDMSGLSLLAAH